MANPTNHPHNHGGHGDDAEYEAPGTGENSQVSWERRDVDIVQITGFGIGLLVAFVVSVAAMYGLFEYFKVRENNLEPKNQPSMMTQKQLLPPEPRLQAEPVLELEKMRANEDMLLNSYGWVDSAKGTVHIPIDQAIEMVAQKGLPVKVSMQGGDHDGYRTIPSDASGGRTLEKIAQ
jgi:hypothetical protein